MKKFLLSLFIILTSSILIFSQEQDDGLTYEEYLENQPSEEVVLEEEALTTEVGNISTSSNPYFDLELVRGFQSPLSKKISFKVNITPKIDSSKTQIIWSIPSVFTVEESHPSFVSLNKGETYTYTAKLHPKKEGKYDISVNVVSWQFNSNKSNSVSQNVTLSSSLVVQPVDTMYIVTLLLFVLLIIALTAGFIYLLNKSIKLLIKKAKVWLTPPT